MVVLWWREGKIAVERPRERTAFATAFWDVNEITKRNILSGSPRALSSKRPRFGEPGQAPSSSRNEHDSDCKTPFSAARGAAYKLDPWTQSAFAAHART